MPSETPSSPRVNSYGVLIDEMNFGALAEYAAQLARDVDEANARAAGWEKKAVDLRGAMETCAESEGGRATIDSVHIAELEQALAASPTDAQVDAMQFVINDLKRQLEEANVNHDMLKVLVESNSGIINTALADEVIRYREALEKYGKHGTFCPVGFYGRSESRCDCGFAEALAQPAQEELKDE